MWVLDQEGLTMNDTIDFAGFEAPVLDERPWAVFSACKETDPTIFFATTRDDERAALVVCSSCSVKDECLNFAVETRERFGVWGGTTERERRRLMRAS
jgi:WhiB family redox-sensing transcriptional regulator